MTKNGTKISDFSHCKGRVSRLCPLLAVHIYGKKGTTNFYAWHLLVASFQKSKLWIRPKPGFCATPKVPFHVVAHLVQTILRDALATYQALRTVTTQVLWRWRLELKGQGITMVGLAQTVDTRGEEVGHLRIPNEKGHGAVSSRHGNMPSGGYGCNLDLTREELSLLFSCCF